MDIYKIKTNIKQMLADTITPVSIYLKMRDLYPKSLLLESSDYRGNENSFSFICMQPIASLTVDDEAAVMEFPDGFKFSEKISTQKTFSQIINSFINAFKPEEETSSINGLFGYSTYNAVKYFETIKLHAPVKENYKIPELKYSLYKYIIAINHFKNTMQIIENLAGEEKSEIDKIELLLHNLNIPSTKFTAEAKEKSNLTDEEYKYMVGKGKEHCYRGDVFQIVLSRQFSQQYQGDDFNVYRALRSVNPSPYLFYFDFGDFRIFGSSPEAQIKVQDGKAYINPIAGTFQRTGDKEKDLQLAEALSKDVKENSEHVMLVDLARNDLSRHARHVKVESYREIQYYSHVLHMVSTVSGELNEKSNAVDMFMATFPAGTLSGAPKYKAMELIDKYENQSRGYYGGALGFMDFKGNLNHAIMIRTFLSKDNTLYYQAGAGIVVDSNEEKELQEVNNKLGALKKAIEIAKTI